MQRKRNTCGTVDARPVVGVTADLRPFDGINWHATPATYIAAVARVADAWPMIVPALGPELETDEFLSRIDGLLATGSRSNVHPARYGASETTEHAPFDPARDATSLPLITGAIERGIPLLAICRGMQELNVALGGTLTAGINRTDMLDHRAPQDDDPDIRFGLRHPVSIRPGGRLAAILGVGPVTVNSLHRQGIGDLAIGLEVEAEAEDGVIEAVSMRGTSGFTIGVQWHPEYFAETDTPSRQLFEAFGSAVRTSRQALLATP